MNYLQDFKSLSMEGLNGNCGIKSIKILISTTAMIRITCIFKSKDYLIVLFTVPQVSMELP